MKIELEIPDEIIQRIEAATKHRGMSLACLLDEWWESIAKAEEEWIESHPAERIDDDLPGWLQ